MQIGTNYSYARGVNLLRSLSDRATALQTSISASKRIATPSDDPVASGRIALIGRQIADGKQFTANINLASALVGQTDSALETFQNQIQRATELATQAANGTLSDTDRAAIAQELHSIVEDLYAVANQTDTRGTALFGGATAGPAYTRDSNGVITYAGSGSAPRIPISATASVQATDSGETLFGGLSVNGQTKDVFAVIGDLAKALAPGGSSSAADLAAKIGDGLTGLSAATASIGASRASIGARGARLDLESERLANADTNLQTDSARLDGFDLQSSIADLQQTMLTLQAAQASFTKLNQLSLFDYLR